jgi:membrane fusion protein (multidrug efflux system)
VNPRRTADNIFVRVRLLRSAAIYGKFKASNAKAGVRDMGFVLRTLAALAAVVALSACKPTSTAQAPPPSMPPAVGVVTVEERGITPFLSFIGRVRAIQIYQVRARVEGFLEKINFKDGQHVRAGDLLYQIEKTQYTASVDQAKANVAAAQAVERNAQLAYDRAAELVKTSSGTQATVDSTRANLDSAKATILQNQAALTIAQENLSYTDIFSPVDGRIGFTAITLGNLVNSASGVLVTVVSDDPIYVEFPVSMRQIADIAAQHKGDITKGENIKVLATLANGKPYDEVGDWRFVSNQVDPQTDTVSVRATFANPQLALVDGAFVTVKVEQGAPQQRLIIPRSALQLDQIGVYVLIVDADKKVQVKRVTTGEAVNTDIAIASGLNAGDKVIIDGIQKVRPGLVVNATDVSGAAGAAK